MITLITPINVVIQQEQIVEFTEINIHRIVDISDRKIVFAFLEQIGELTLWEGSAYDSIGDWTQAQAEARIIELLTP